MYLFSLKKKGGIHFLCSRRSLRSSHYHLQGLWLQHLYVCICACERAHVCVCVRACVHLCVRVCARVHLCVRVCVLCDSIHTRGCDSGYVWCVTQEKVRCSLIVVYSFRSRQTMRHSTNSQCRYWAHSL